jgi:hypothetical protein
MTGVMAFHPFREESLSPALAAPGQGGAATFGAHAGPETVLAFPGAFGRLIGAFHGGSERGVPTVKGCAVLSTRHWRSNNECEDYGENG